MATIEDVRRSLAGHQPEIIPPGDRGHAAVALVVRPQGPDLEVLLIQRVEAKGDRWSGHIAFPGGRVGVEDAGPRQTAERETLEEVGLDLGRADHLGRLDDLAGGMAPIVVSGFVYAVREAPPLVLNFEVEQAFWLPIARLLEAGADPDARHPLTLSTPLIEATIGGHLEVVEILVEHGAVHMRGDLPEARTRLSRAVGAHPGYAGALMQRALAAAGEPSSSGAGPDSLPAELEADAWYELG